MSTTGSPPRVDEETLPPLLSRAVLFGIGGLLLATFLYDAAVEFGRHQTWLIFIENGPGIGLSGAVLAAGWGLTTRYDDPTYLSGTAKGCLIGFAGGLAVGALLLALRQIHGGGSPMVYMLTTMGTFSGTVVGYFQARRTRVRRQLRTITNNVRQGIYESTREDGLIFANPAFVDMFGYDGLDEILQANPDRFYADPARRDELMDMSLREDGIERVGVHFQRKDGSTFPGRLTGQPIRCREGSPQRFVGIIADVTEQKRRMEELREAKQEAESAVKLKTAMLGNISHEVRTPLTSITGFAEIIEERIEGELAEFARRIEESGERLRQTLDAVLTLSRLEAGSYDLPRQNVCLSCVVRETRELFQSKAAECEIALDVEMNGRVEASVNESAVRHVLQNLVENAIKFTLEGGTVLVRAWDETESVVLEVEDTGIGMEESEIEEIFDPFVQSSSGTDREYEGTGLGLSIVSRFVEAMNGTIDLETEKGEGSRFTVRLPREESPASPSSSE